MVYYTEIGPDKFLEKYVACYVIIENFDSKLENNDFYIMPSCNPQLVVMYKDNYIDQFANNSLLPDNPLLGPITSYRIFEAVGRVGLFSIVFKPMGIALLLNDTLSGFADFFVSSNDLTNKIQILRDRLLDAKDNSERVAIANNMLRNYCCKIEFSKIKLPINHVTSFIRKKRGNVNIAELAYNFNCSVSKLERNFRELTGITPKKYASIIRLKNAIKMGVHNIDLMDITYILGYFDQAHFIKEFKSFTGHSPLEYFSSERNYRKEFMRQSKKEEALIPMTS